MDRIILLTLIVLYLTFNGCITDEESYTNFKAVIKNESVQVMTIRTYSSDNLIFENVLEQNETSESCEYTDLFFFGYNCGIDSVIFKFDNGKGYISVSPLPPSMNEYEFPNKSPFGAIGYVRKENTTYEFIVTEEDYNNAFDID